MSASKRSRSLGERERSEMLLEEIRGDVKQAAEGHAVLDRKLDETRRELTGRMDRLEQTLGHAIMDNSRAIRGLETRVAGVETKVGGLETKVAGLETKVGELDGSIGRLTERFDVHERAHAAS